nr:zinc ribbon domain-containing protein [Candidatus Freyrarchaeum guaymaensis]HDO81334.1 hypothetical protein [Candidatus Bathyarchaeota archaeon]
MSKERKETLAVEDTWPIGAYMYKGPKLYNEIVEGFKRKKIIASLCTGCGRVFFPPRNICGRCWRKIDARREVSDVGTITSFTISPEIKRGQVKVLGLDPVEAGIVKDGERLIMVYVNFDGTDTNYATVLLNAKPEEVHVGMRVKAVWKEKPEGLLSDMEGVEPIRKESTQ